MSAEARPPSAGVAATGAAPDSADKGSSSFPRLGISLAGVRHFIDAHGGNDAFRGKTTTAVCDEFVKPATLAAQTSYCEHHKRDKCIGAATVFVSHAWKYEFLNVVAALEHWQSKQLAPAFFWFDIFTNAQHSTGDRPFEWWRDVFQTNVGRLGRTLLVLEWDKPIPLSRIWCVWEIASTVETGAALEVIMNAQEEASFQKALMTDFDSLVYKTCIVDIETAEAFNPADLANILQAIRGTIGFHEANKRVIGAMQEWMAAAGRAALDALRDDERPNLSLLSSVGTLLNKQGKLAEAEPLYREDLEVSRRTLGDTHPHTLVSISNMAGLLKDQGKLAEAKPLYREALEARRRTLGDTHPNTLVSISNMAGLLQDQGKLAEAEPLYREALEARRRTLGDTHPSTLVSISNMAGLLKARGKLAEAEPLYHEALEVSRRTLGDTHPNTLSCVNKMAQLLKAMRRPAKAEPLYREALAGRCAVLGPAHPDSRRSLSDLVAVLKAQGKLAEAAALEGGQVQGEGGQ